MQILLYAAHITASVIQLLDKHKSTRSYRSQVRLNKPDKQTRGWIIYLMHAPILKKSLFDMIREAVVVIVVHSYTNWFCIKVNLLIRMTLWYGHAFCVTGPMVDSAYRRPIIRNLGDFFVVFFSKLFNERPSFRWSETPWRWFGVTVKVTTWATCCVRAHKHTQPHTHIHTYIYTEIRSSFSIQMRSYISTRWVDGTPTTEVTPVTIWYIHSPDLGHQMVMVMVMNDLLPPSLCNVNRDLPFRHFKIWPWKPMAKVMCVVKGQGHVWPSKFKGQVHGQGQTHWSHLGPGVQSICLLFVSWQSGHFSLRYRKFHIWPWKLKVKVMTQVKPDGHIWGIGVQSICLFFVSWQSDHFLAEI